MNEEIKALNSSIAGREAVLTQAILALAVVIVSEISESTDEERRLLETFYCNLQQEIRNLLVAPDPGMKDSMFQTLTKFQDLIQAEIWKR